MFSQHMKLYMYLYYIFSFAIAIFILIQYLWYRKCRTEENNEIGQADLQLQERQTEFVANVSHELKTPIAVVSSQIEMLELMGDKIDRAYYFHQSMKNWIKCQRWSENFWILVCWTMH